MRMKNERRKMNFSRKMAQASRMNSRNGFGPQPSKCLNYGLVFLMTAYMGEMLDVDAYNQPGVELSKVYTKACLHMKGYNEYAKNINEFKKNKAKFTLK